MKKNHIGKGPQGYRSAATILGIAVAIGLLTSAPAEAGPSLGAGPSLVGQNLSATSQKREREIKQGLQEIRDEAKRKQTRQEIAAVKAAGINGHDILESGNHSGSQGNHSGSQQSGSTDSGICVSQPGALVTWCLPIHVRNLSPRVSGMNVQCAAFNKANYVHYLGALFDMRGSVAHASTGISFSNWPHNQTRSYNHTIILTARRPRHYSPSIKNKPFGWTCEVTLVCGSDNCSEAEGLGSAKTPAWKREGKF